MIKAKNILLRPVEEVDLDMLFVLESAAFLQMDNAFFTMESFYKFKQRFYQTGFWNDDEGISLILDKQGRILGKIEYRKCNSDALTLYFLLYKEEDRGQGYMGEALPLFASFLFAIKKINRLQLDIPDYNTAAIAAAQKGGFSFEGIARQALFQKGRYLDLCVYSLLREESKPVDKF